MRRYQVLIESAFPTELGGLFKNLENKAATPGAWRPGPASTGPRTCRSRSRSSGQDVEDASEVDYLFWVGCAGAYEDRAKKTTRAVAELLDTAGVSFAVLGDGESCTGDPARRAGNEFLFQMLAQANVETLNEVKADQDRRDLRALLQHASRTSTRSSAASYEVVHHTQLLNRLVREKKLVPVARPDRRRQPRASPRPRPR